MCCVVCTEYTRSKHPNMIKTRNVYIDQKADEMGIVEMANAIIDPGTMVIYQ